MEILGVKDSGAYIGLVTDAATKAIDGHITPGGILVITGDKLRIAPADDPEMGIFFVDENGDKEHIYYPEFISKIPYLWYLKYHICGIFYNNISPYLCTRNCRKKVAD
jgi:hypothetical protein